MQQTSQSAVQTPRSALQTSQSAVQTSESAVQTSESALQTSQSAVQTPQSAVQTPPSAVQMTPMTELLNSFVGFSFAERTSQARPEHIPDEVAEYLSSIPLPTDEGMFIEKLYCHNY